MAGSPPFPPPEPAVDLIVLYFGAGLDPAARLLREGVLRSVDDVCAARNVRLRLHELWPPDAEGRAERRSDDVGRTSADELRDLMRRNDAFVFALVGPDLTDADADLIRFVRDVRPGWDPRVLFVFLPRPDGDPEAAQPWLAELRRGARVHGDRRVTAESLERALRELLTGSEALDTDAPPGAVAREKPVRKPPAAVVDENVQFTVYRPNAVQPEVWYPLLAFAHLAERRPGSPASQPSPLDQVRALAAQAGVDTSYGQPRVDARGGVPREGQLTFVPSMSGVTFNPRSQTFGWEEDVHQQNFRLKADAAAAGRTLRGQLTVYLGAFILADIDLAFGVDISAPPPPSPAAPALHLLSASPVHDRGMTPVSAVPYQKVFPSYSHKDLAIVSQAETYGNALHVYVRDRLALRSGELWEERLLQLIDEADIFQLFWSSNSMTSEYVRREWEHALALNRPAFIRPVYWEVPMPHSTDPRLPPDALAALHFHGFFEESGDDRDPAPPRPAPAPPLSAYDASEHGQDPPGAAARGPRVLRLLVALVLAAAVTALVIYLLRG